MKQKAFPIIEEENDGITRGKYYKYVSQGMDLRDYFACHAMQGEISASESQPDPQFLSEYAYKVADAMMEARDA